MAALLLLLRWALVAGVITVVAEVAVTLASSLVCAGAVAARPVSEPDVTGWEEEGASVGAGEESQAFMGTIARSFTRS